MKSVMVTGATTPIGRALVNRLVADAAHVILTKPAREFTGNFCIDEEVLAPAGITDLSGYSAGPASELIKDLFVP